VKSARRSYCGKVAGPTSLQIDLTVTELSKGLRTAEAAASRRHKHRSALLHSPYVPAYSSKDNPCYRYYFYKGTLFF